MSTVAHFFMIIVAQKFVITWLTFSSTFTGLALRDQSAPKYFTLYLPAYMTSQLLRADVLVHREMLVQIRQHFQAAVNKVYQIRHMFNAIFAANPVGIQRPEVLLFIVVGLDGPAQLV